MKRAGRFQSCTGLMIQFLSQRLDLLPIFGVKAFGEPVVDWGEEFAGFGLLTLLLPQAGEAVEVFHSFAAPCLVSQRLGIQSCIS